MIRDGDGTASQVGGKPTKNVWMETDVGEAVE